jgi:stress-induced morphogen
MSGLPLKEPRELHFRVEIVSEAFEDLSKVKRQRAVYQVREEKEEVYKESLLNM